jgi:hypothetical protein
MKRLGLVFALAAVVAWAGVALLAEPYEPQEGDVVFQSLGPNELSAVIESATRSPYSHCGVVLREGDRWVVIEAVGPVKKTPLAVWVEQGRGRKYAAYRLTDGFRAKLPEFRRELESFLGKPYDIRYQWSDDAIYCSELVYKAFERATGESLGRRQKLGELDWQPHEEFIRRIERGGLPLEREMITPVALSNAPQLSRVYSSWNE